MKQLIIAIKATVVLTLLTGIAYPLLVTGLAKALFPYQANGSMVQVNGRTAGSAIIGQNFTKPEYFHGRPSASNYDGLASGGSAYGPTNQKLIDRVQADLKAFRAGNPTFSGPVPADLLTASGSGLDPDLSPESAEAQAARIATARGMDLAAVRGLIAANTQSRQLGFFGEPRVNVLKLNLALDQAAPVRK